VCAPSTLLQELVQLVDEGLVSRQPDKARKEWLIPMQTHLHGPRAPVVVGTDRAARVIAATLQRAAEVVRRASEVPRDERVGQVAPVRERTPDPIAAPRPRLVIFHRRIEADLHAVWMEESAGVVI